MSLFETNGPRAVGRGNSTSEGPFLEEIVQRPYDRGNFACEGFLELVVK